MIAMFHNHLIFVEEICAGCNPITAVDFDGIDVSVLDFFDNADVIRLTVLAFPVLITVKVDEIAGVRDIGDGFALGVRAGRLLPTVVFFELASAYLQF